MAAIPQRSFHPAVRPRAVMIAERLVRRVRQRADQALGPGGRAYEGDAALWPRLPAWLLQAIESAVSANVKVTPWHVPKTLGRPAIPSSRVQPRWPRPPGARSRTPWQVHRRKDEVGQCSATYAGLQLAGFIAHGVLVCTTERGRVSSPCGVGGAHRRLDRKLAPHFACWCRESLLGFVP